MKEATKGRVLVITYYWPPSGGPGVQRPLKFVKYLVKLGWTVDVLTVKDGEYPVLDPELEGEVPPEVKVIRSPAIEFFHWYKRLTGQDAKKGLDTFILNSKKVGFFGKVARWVRMNLFVPDARIGWVPYAIKAGGRHIRRHRPDVIFSTSPPHSLQRIAKVLSTQYGIPWVADFRDPWTNAFWDSGIGRTAFAERKNKRLEQSALRHATRITTVSKGVMKLLNAPAGKTDIIPNGWDEEDFKECNHPGNAKCTIVYAGYLAESQNPTGFLEALARLTPGQREVVRVEMYGRQDLAFHSSIQAHGVAHLFEFKGYVSHEEVIRRICRADILLLVIPKEHGTGILTGKLFEYLATKNFILGIGDPAGEAAAILRECAAGEMVDHDTVPSSLLTQQLERWKRGERVPVNETAIGRYSRRALARQLDKILEACK